MNEIKKKLKKKGARPLLELLEVVVEVSDTEGGKKEGFEMGLWLLYISNTFVVSIENNPYIF